MLESAQLQGTYLKRCESMVGAQAQWITGMFGNHKREISYVRNQFCIVEGNGMVISDVTLMLRLTFKWYSVPCPSKDLILTSPDVRVGKLLYPLLFLQRPVQKLSRPTCRRHTLQIWERQRHRAETGFQSHDPEMPVEAEYSCLYPLSSFTVPIHLNESGFPGKAITQIQSLYLVTWTQASQVIRNALI